MFLSAAAKTLIEIEAKIFKALSDNPNLRDPDELTGWHPFEVAPSIYDTERAHFI